MDAGLLENESQNKFLFNGKVAAKRRFRYCGKKDALTGYYQYGFRDYDAQLGLILIKI
ncbi:MAG: hypothetical protein JXR51_15350 [Bacteroidales bacterium]|nr:hypothetical protein [Bacteroidales bacterium]MBN2758547.1 hypothetical protein [Bacteroidales bacterium]